MFNKLLAINYKVDFCAKAIEDLGERLGEEHPDFREIKEIANSLFVCAEESEEVAMELKNNA